MRKLLTDRRAVSSFEYAMLAAAIGLVLVQVLQVPADALMSVLSNFFGTSGGGMGH